MNYQQSGSYRIAPNRVKGKTVYSAYYTTTTPHTPIGFHEDEEKVKQLCRDHAASLRAGEVC